MKYVFAMWAWMAIVTSVSAQSPIATLTTTTEVAAVAWEKTAHDFGTMKHQVPQTVEFSLKHRQTIVNRTAEPVVITNAKGSCGCTVANYTREAIAPGAAGTVSATYNAAKLGAFTKTVTVTTSAGGKPQVLRIKGIVVE